MANTFDWVEIRASDIERTAHFFEQLFGWQVVRRLGAGGDTYLIFDTGSVPRVENLRRGALSL